MTQIELTSPSRSTWKKVPDTVYLFVGFYLFFLLNLTANFSGPHDSMGYLNDFERSRDLLPAPHLLYHITTYYIFHFLRWLLPHAHSYYLVESIDAAWGCLGLTVVYRIFLNRMGMSRLQAFGGTAVAAFSFGMWFYCSNIEVYMPSTFFLMLGLYVCTKQRWESSDILKITLVHCLAVLFHQANVLFAPIVLWKIWYSRKDIPMVRALLRYAIGSVVGVGGIYVIVGWVIDGNNTPATFYSWIRGYTLQSGYWFPLAFSTFFHVAVGLGHAFFGAHYIFRISFLEAIMKRVFYYHSLDDEAYLVRNLSHGMAAFLLVLTVLVVLLMVVLLVRIIRHWRTLMAQHKHLMVPLLLFLAAYSCFFYFWMPENLEFWIPQSVVIWIFLLGINSLLPSGGFISSNKYFYLGLALVMFFVNYQGSIRWMKDIRNDVVYIKTEKLKDVATAKDVVVLQDPWLLSYFLEQFTPATIVEVPVKPADISALNQKVDSCLSSGGRVYLYTEGSSVHTSANHHYIDSLISMHNGAVSDLNNPLTPVKVIAGR